MKPDDLIRRAMSELGKRSAKKRTSKQQSEIAKSKWRKFREAKKPSPKAEGRADE